MNKILWVFAVIGMLPTFITIVHWLILWRCRIAMKQNEKKKERNDNGN